MVERIRPTQPEEPQTRVPLTAPAGAKPRERKIKPGYPLVRVTYHPGQIAYLVLAGPEQSELKWTHNGNMIIVCNEHIERINPNE